LEASKEFGGAAAHLPATRAAVDTLEVKLAAWAGLDHCDIALRAAALLRLDLELDAGER